MESLPREFLHPLKQLRILNLAGNQLADMDLVDLSLHNKEDILEKLILDGNPLKLSSNSSFPLPLTRQLSMSNCGIEKLVADRIVIQASELCGQIERECRSIRLRSGFWGGLETLDISHNPLTTLNAAILPLLSNLTALKMSYTRVGTDLLSWVTQPTTRCRHLDISHARVLPFEPQPLPAAFHFISLSVSRSAPRARWNYCGGELEW